MIPYESYRSCVFSSLKAVHGWNGCSAYEGQFEWQEHIITDGWQLEMPPCEVADYLAADAGLVGVRVLVPEFRNVPGRGIVKRPRWVCPSRVAV